MHFKRQLQEQIELNKRRKLFFFLLHNEEGTVMVVFGIIFHNYTGIGMHKSVLLDVFPPSNQSKNNSAVFLCFFFHWSCFKLNLVLSVMKLHCKLCSDSSYFFI